MEKVRKIFIDCGAWTGDSIRAFHEHDKTYEIYAFECEPRLKNTLIELADKFDFSYINKAVWVKDGILKLFLGKNDLTQSSSLLSEKKKYIVKDKPVEVDSIDFSQWILDSFHKEDLIICKMNIEGAEYNVLEKMLTDGSIDYIDKLYISWHWNKLEGFSKEKHDQIEKDVKKRTQLIRWKFVEGETENPFI